MVFLSGEKDKIGFLDDQDVIRSGAVQEILGEVLKQLAKEAEIDTWMQAERTKASTESTWKSRPSSEKSSKRSDFDSGAGTSSKPTHRSKRKRGQRCNKRRHEDSPALEVPFTIAKEVSGDAAEPPEKRSREEETAHDGMTLPLSFLFSLLFLL